MKKPKLPKTDSIEKLAEFWDQHDLTNFSAELEEVTEPVFVRTTGRATGRTTGRASDRAAGASVRIALPAAEAQRLRRIARAKGVRQSTVLRNWILERLHAPARTTR